MRAPHSTPNDRPTLFGLNRNVFYLGVVSFLTDVSSEMIFTILPLFLFNVLRVGAPVVGLIEGIAESTATLLKVFSGWLSDRLGRRKTLAAIGYGLSTVAKPMLYFAGSWLPVLGVRFTDRLGKGLRTSPRDALIADSTSPRHMGRSFGFHRAMDSAGAVVGLGVAAAIVFSLQRGGWELTRATYQVLVLVGVVPAVMAVAVVAFAVHEPGRVPGGHLAGEFSSVTTQPARLSRSFKAFLPVMVLFTLGNAGDAFLVLRAQDVGLSVFQILLVFVLFNLIYTLVSLPAGVISDRFGRRRVIVFGWSARALCYLGLALSSTAWHLWLLFSLYGLYYGVTEGATRALVADMVGRQRRGVAYGLFHGSIGITAMPASLLAGWLWHWVDPAAPFVFGAVLAIVAAFCLSVVVRE